MRKKLQVFISSTFTDLIEERQVAVKAVLNSGHIPAGMELFTAGDESQKQIIKRWIDESDAYVLILGGRYGSIDKETGKSYTHWEYDYAGEAGKPRFAIVLSDKAIDNKVVILGYKDATEQNNPQLHKDFREGLLAAKLVSPVDDHKDIEISIFKSLREIEQRTDLNGWISGKDVPDNSEILQDNVNLYIENQSLNKELFEIKLELDKLTKKSQQEITFSGFSYEEVKKALLQKVVEVPSGVMNGPAEQSDLLFLFTAISKILATGVPIDKSSKHVSSPFIFRNVVPSLMIYGLLEINENKLFVSKSGFKFLARYEQESIKKIGKGKRTS
jgi:regulator of replication initiation timing